MVGTDKVSVLRFIFITQYPEYWHEGLEEDEVKKIKRITEGKFRKLYRKCYWRFGKSYVFQNKLTDHCFCITKKYYDEL